MHRDFITHKGSVELSNNIRVEGTEVSDEWNDVHVFVSVGSRLYFETGKVFIYLFPL